ncbi:MAG: hypothetical protein KKA60_06335 [Proteobacteria bacterium]|nr:hypothetical protein [Pseudomonadota bacterium]
MPFDDENTLVGTSASDKLGAEAPDFAGGGDKPEAGGLASAEAWSQGAAQDPVRQADNTSVGSVSVSS